MRRRFLILLLVVVVLAVVAPYLFFAWLGSQGLPRRSGDATLARLEEAVEVRFDGWGVPHLSARSGVDLAAALGYLHANDRFVQMELGRRAATGRLSELFGEQTLEVDRRFRHLRLRRSAKSLWEGLAGESRDWLLAYADGVNAWLDERGGDLPPMLKLLRLRPEPWQPEDSLAFVYLMANDLSFWNDRPEEERFVWLRQLGPERTADLVRAGSAEEVHVPAALLAMLARAAEEAASGAPGEASSGGESATEEAGETGSPGSNSWAVGPSRTASGGALLANDPHLPLQLPGTWYQVHMRAPDYEAAGVTLPGLPGVVIGRSAHLAWSLTHTMLDDHDVFFEQVDERERVRRGEDWVPLESEVETISLKGGRSIPVRLLATDRGPLLEPDLESRIPARSLAWTIYEGGDPLSAFLGLARSRTLDEVPAAVTGFVGPPQNLVVADREGGLLYTVLGRVPVRRTGDGRLPAPGWDPSYGWDGLRPAEANPVERNPESDLLVTANNDLRREGWEPFVADFDLPYRAQRIEERLRQRQGWDAASLLAVQTDVVSEYARELVRRIDGDYEGEAARAHAALVEWDGSMTEVGPSALFALFDRALGQSLFADEARRFGVGPFDTRRRVLAVLAGTMDPAWIDDVTTEPVESRDEIIARALVLAWQQGTARWGPDTATWRYGDLHQLLLQHPGSALPFIGDWYDRGPLSLPGSATTVAAFGGRWSGESLNVVYGPSARFVADMAEPDRSILVLPAGQSGHPKDPHYDDQIELYRSGGVRPMAWTEEAIAAATVSTLRLLPSSGA